ncbi:MAG: hypothetical protein LBD14_06920 [Puniceicoccales bacterium]|jgi:hypothetical protein|nr:hypothetical protein [Puniceicoccales bacterium]
MLLAASGFAANAADDGLVARWSFDGSAKNAVVGKFDATIGKRAPNDGGPKFVPGVFGQALEFSGKLGVAVGPEVLPKDLRALTFSAWVAPQNLNGNLVLLRKEDGDNRLLFAFQEAKFLTLGLNCGRSYLELDALISPEEILDGHWHFVAGTFDGKTMRVYLDGREIGSCERQAPLNTVYDYYQRGQASWADARASTAPAADVVGEPLFIGSMLGKEEFFQGRMDDVRFYSKALDAGQIDGLYREGGKFIQKEPPPVRAVAQGLYSKKDSFLGTLETIRLGATNDPRLPIEVQRLLRADFPEEVNAYIRRNQRNPVAYFSNAPSERREIAKRLANDAFEYLPLTDLQWSVLPARERARWERAKVLKALVEDASKPVSAAVLVELEALIDPRPKQSEPVAGREKPQTPATVTLSKSKARALLEKEWLYQCDNKPTVGVALKEIGYARKILGRIKLSADATRAYAQKLDALEKAGEGFPDLASTDKAYYLKVRELKREIMFKNPVIDFDSVLYIDTPNPIGSEWQHETRHRLGYMGRSGGGRLLVQKGLGPDGKLTQLAPSAPLHGVFWRPDLSYDASKVLFSFKPHNEKTFHIYEIGLDGTGLRQLTGGMFDDLDPIYLPDGKNIMFLTTRGHIYVRCMPPTNAFVTARMALDTKPGDRNLYIISRNGEPEYTPAVMNDGRVLFTRWEYTDKPLWRAQSLWTMGQNGSYVQTFWGNQSVWPDLLKDARSIPGSNRVMFTGSAHHNWFAGSVGIIDPSKGLNFPDGLTKVTADVEWPESGNGPVDPKESPDYHRAGNYVAYYSPYPLSEKDFLVSARRSGRAGGGFALLLMDVDGNRELINQGAHNIWDAIPIRKRPLPPVMVDTLAWPTWAERNAPKPGILYSNNVYDGADPILQGKARYLRIWSIEHKTYTYWYKRPTLSTGPEISLNQSEGVKKIIGTVPIESDGSVNFVVPSGIAVHFQLLDKDHLALQTMKSFTGVQPGETRGCFGCHEQHMNSPVSPPNAMAMRRAPSPITPVPWNDITVGFERYVQPALDKYCGKCHQDPGHEGYKKFNATLRPGFLGFKEPYATLMGDPTWASGYHNRKSDSKPGRGGFGWADTILVESYSTVDPKAYATYPPMKKLSYKSRLVERMSSGKHHGVKVDPENLLRVILWVDAMGPYYGAEEVRKIEDPTFQGVDWISQRPRVRTAPIVQRPGPFDPFDTAGDEAYHTPSPDKYNALPHGVTR